MRWARDTPAIFCGALPLAWDPEELRELARSSSTGRAKTGSGTGAWSLRRGVVRISGKSLSVLPEARCVAADGDAPDLALGAAGLIASIELSPRHARPNVPNLRLEVELAWYSGAPELGGNVQVVIVWSVSCRTRNFLRGGFGGS